MKKIAKHTSRASEPTTTTERATTGRIGRREVLKLLGVTGATVGALPVNGPASAHEPAHAADHSNHHHMHRSETSERGRYFLFFNLEEAAFVEAAVDTLIPSDATGPGARELDVAIFIDRQMAGSYGKGDRLYLQGPFVQGTASQGYQLPMTPSELLRTGIADMRDFAQERYGAPFEVLSGEVRTAIIRWVEQGEVTLPNVPSAIFFALLLQLTIEGYFADPIYGGNKDKAAWKMIGFPGAAAMYMDKIEPFRNRPYTAEPQGIQDLS